MRDKCSAGPPTAERAFAAWCQRVLVITRLYTNEPWVLVCQLSSVIRLRSATGQASLLQQTQSQIYLHDHSHHLQAEMVNWLDLSYLGKHVYDMGKFSILHITVIITCHRSH
ncbi:hypothetical protein AMECASPLE_027694 [Ameca splendens]|uniref:Uncharacterized protein n=1 Tax=Ameca splendens TaxID=208324 RepID=A0ABV1A3V2_9TELE